MTASKGLIGWITGTLDRTTLIIKILLVLMVSLTFYSGFSISQLVDKVTSVEVLKLKESVLSHELNPLQHGEAMLCPERLLNSWLYGYHGNSPGPESSFPTADMSVSDSTF